MKSSVPRPLLAGILVIALARSMAFADLPTQKDPRLIPVFHADRVWNAVTTTRDGRVFVGFPGADGPGVQLEELTPDGHGHPYPDAAWNGWKPGQDARSSFVHINAIRIGPDGVLWVIDAGAEGMGKPAVPGGARIIGFDLFSNRVARIYPLAGATREKSYIDDIRFSGNRGYITDAGAPGLIVLDLKTGAVRRVLDQDPSTMAHRPMRADGRIVRDKQGKELQLQADQIEISPDGSYVYYQPACGPLARIQRHWLDDATLSPSALASHVEAWLDTPTSGGTAIDANGNIYYGDADRRRILKITPDKSISTLVADPRLIWSDAMWIDHQGFLWIPATQQNLTPGFNDGRQAVHYPVWIYKMQIHARPAPNDHS